MCVDVPSGCIYSRRFWDRESVCPQNVFIGHMLIVVVDVNRGSRREEQGQEKGETSNLLII